jgi:hypothetical protein
MPSPAGLEARRMSFVFGIIAVSGDPVPGSAPETFTSFGGGDDGPALNECGQVAFRAFTSGGQGVFVTRGGTLQAVARTGDPVPDCAAMFASFGNPGLNDQDEVAFLGSFGGTQGVFATCAGQLSKLAQTGDPVPGSGSDERFTDFDGSIPLLNNAGDVAFRGLFDGGEGIFVARSGELRVVARTGQPVPDTNLGETFEGFSSPVLNDAGEVAFRAAFGVGSGIFLDRNQQLDVLARTGQPIDDATFTDFSRPALNSAGDVAFNGRFGAARGVIVTREQQLHVVVRTGDPLPGSPGASFLFASAPALNQQGDVAFEAVFDDGGAGLDVLLLARVPGMTIIHQEESGEPTLFDMVLNDDGAIAFELSDIDSILLVTRGGDPAPVPSDRTLEFRPGDVRVLERADLLSGDGKFVYAGNGDGLASGFNNQGQVAFLAQAVPSAAGEVLSAIVLATPEPGAPSA